MIWFQRLFPVFMLLTPALFTLLTKTKTNGTTRSAAKRLTKALWLATAVALVIHLTVCFSLESLRPANDATRVIWPPLISVSGSLLLWLRWAAPALVAKNPAFNPQAASVVDSSVRTASLVPRHLQSPIGRPAWIFGWVLFAICTAVTLWAVNQGAPTLLILGLGWWIGMAVFGSQQSLQEGEPRDARNSPELETAYRSLRAFRSWCFYTLGLLGTLAFSFVAALVIARPDLAGMTGAILGISLGLAGALFGVLAAVHRLKVNELRLQLDRDS